MEVFGGVRAVCGRGGMFIPAYLGYRDSSFDTGDASLLYPVPLSASLGSNILLNLSESLVISVSL